MIRNLLLSLSCCAVSACATLQPHQNWSPDYTAGCPSPATPANDTSTSYLSANCAAVREVRGRAHYYSQRATGIGREEALLSGLSVTALVATAGFSVFDAHPDNIRAAALAGATSEGTRRTLNTIKRRDLYNLAFRRAACVQASAAPLLAFDVDTAHESSAEILPQLRDAIAKSKKDLEKLDVLIADGEFLSRYDLRPGALTAVDSSLRDLRGAPLRLKIIELKAERTELAALIERADKAYRDGLSGFGAIERAPAVIRAEMGLIEDDLAKQIEAMQIDVSNFLKKLAEDLAANVDAAKKVSEAAARVPSAEIANTVRLRRLADQTEALKLKSYADASGAVATCHQRVAAEAAKS